MIFASASAGAGWWGLHRGQESTDDAQVEGRVINVSSRISGQVIRVHVSDNQNVNVGDILIELDPADYIAKRDAARADLAAARASARSARAALELTRRTAPAGIAQAQGGWVAAASSNTAARATLHQRQAAVAASEAKRTLAELEWKRARQLLAADTISQAELDARRATLDTTTADLDAAKAQLQAATATIDAAGGEIQAARARLSAAQTEKEQVEGAEAAVELADARVAQTEAALQVAELNLGYTTIRSTKRGVVSRRSVEEGQLVSPERPLFAIVPQDDVWIVANFKEDQLGHMTVGNSSTVAIDTYAGRTFRAHVASVAGGTGARFALLPPDNATGNFVKVVQRVPVLLRIDEGTGLPLRPGMSAYVTVDTRSR